jgi:glycosyltransferase involved in cell wall biosynthesis
MALPDLAIIVTSYQMPWHLRLVLESIDRQQTALRLEVVVADDGSIDETPRVVADFARQAQFPVHFVTHPHTCFHAARCRNDGARRAKAPHFLFVDGDCLLPPNHVEQHMAASRPGVATCSYCVRLDQEVSQQATIEAVRSGEFAAWATAEQRSRLRHMHYKALWYGLIGHATKPSFRSGNFALARNDFERVNGFDENFLGWGCEDDDFGRRLKAVEVKTVSVLNRTFVYHLWHPPTPTRPRQWKEGGNVAYLQRPVRLIRCLSGLVRRQASDLTVRIVNEGTIGNGICDLIARHGWTVERSGRAATDLELLGVPGRGRFTARADCRVLAVFDESLASKTTQSQAHLVLSPGGTVGSSGQLRLRLDDLAGFWSALNGPITSSRQAAA